MQHLRFIICVVSIFLIVTMTGCERELPYHITLVDPNATPATRALFVNLDRLSPNFTLFGHQDALAYGVHWRNDEPGRSDVKDVTGSHPAVYGWEIGDLELGAGENLDGVNFDNMRRWVVEAYERGGVNTMSWHMNNPATGGNSWDTEGEHRAVSKILPGGELHEMYIEWLDRFAEFINGIRAYTGTANEHPVPIIFRPFHEHTGSWFWWGADHCAPDEYNSLWQFTVEYLRDEKELRNLLWAFSPAGGAADSEEAYLERYPGDEYVDILGFDDYRSVRRPYDVETLANRLRLIARLAGERDKIPALTETGYEGIPDPEWWTGTLLSVIKTDSLTQRIAWALVWRNANQATDRENHFYAPFPGHPSADNFIDFRNDPLILFEDDLPDMYSIP
jgi:mannan endo-1,4-beta-mannosidase